MAQQCIKAIVSGRVQGVFFRDSTRIEALRYGITGHAINKPDGTVEVVACGDKDQLKKLLEWLHQGPVYADVSHVTVHDLPFIPSIDFNIG